MNKTLLISVSTIILFICGCIQQQSERMTGYIVKMNDTKILVAKDGEHNQPRAMYLTITPDTKIIGGTQPKVGNYVEAEVKGNVVQSFPEKAEAQIIKIQEEPILDLKLSRSQAIEKVLNHVEKTDKKDIIAVNVEFLKESNEWKVETIYLLDKSNPEIFYVNLHTGDIRK